jgi:hypothetical protein
LPDLAFRGIQQAIGFVVIAQSSDETCRAKK